MYAVRFLNYLVFDCGMSVVLIKNDDDDDDDDEETVGPATENARVIKVLR